MIIKEYVGSLDIVSEEKLKKIKPKKDKLMEYKDQVEQGKKPAPKKKESC